MKNHPIQILLLEDDADNAVILEQKIRQLDSRYQVTVRHRLMTGLDELRNVRFDLILLDLNLPDSDGLDSVRRTVSAVRNYSPKTAIVLLTANNNEELALQAIKYGAQDYLYKPGLTQSQLARAIRYALERTRIMQALHNANHLLESSLKAHRQQPLLDEHFPRELQRRPDTLWLLLGLQEITEQYQQRGLQLVVQHEGVETTLASFRTHAFVLQTLAHLLELFTKHMWHGHYSISVIYLPASVYLLFFENSGMQNNTEKLTAEKFDELFGEDLAALETSIKQADGECIVQFVPQKTVDISIQLPAPPVLTPLADEEFDKLAHAQLAA